MKFESKSTSMLPNLQLKRRIDSNHESSNKFNVANSANKL